MNDAALTIKRALAPIGLGLLAPVLLTAYMGCKKDEPPPPLPSAAPEETAAAPLELEPEDAGPEDADADADKPKKGGKGVRRKGGLAACCSALKQNAANAPPPTNLYLMQAAAICSSLNAQGKDKASAAGSIAGALKGAGLPAACR